MAARAIASLRCEIFPADLDVTVDFYTRVLGFELVKDQRTSDEHYVFMRLGQIRIGAVQHDRTGGAVDRRPPTGVELVLEVGDLEALREQVDQERWPILEDVQLRPWGLRDFRLLDPDGYYLRFTTHH